MSNVKKKYNQDNEGKNKVGRKTKMTEERLKNLEECFRLGMPKIKACASVGIDRDTLLNYERKNPSFTAQIEFWQKAPYRKGLESLISSFTTKVIKNKKGGIERIIPANYENIKFYLKSKHKDEFSERTELTGKDGGAIEMNNNNIIID
jgi:hypothetical protein